MSQCFNVSMSKAFPILGILTAALLSYALYQGLVLAPTERTMGDVQRIFYYHVPSAWTAFLLFFINFVASVRYLVGSKPAANLAAKVIAIAIGVGGCIAAFVVPLPSGVHPSSVATTALAVTALYFFVGKYFTDQALDALAVTTAEVG